MAKDSGEKYEVEAMRYDAVTDFADTNGFSVFILKEDGTVVQKIEPQA